MYETVVTYFKEEILWILEAGISSQLILIPAMMYLLYRAGFYRSEIIARMTNFSNMHYWKMGLAMMIGGMLWVTFLTDLGAIHPIVPETYPIGMILGGVMFGLATYIICGCPYLLLVQLGTGRLGILAVIVGFYASYYVTSFTFPGLNAALEAVRGPGFSGTIGQMLLFFPAFESTAKWIGEIAPGLASISNYTAGSIEYLTWILDRILIPATAIFFAISFMGIWVYQHVWCAPFCFIKDSLLTLLGVKPRHVHHINFIYAFKEAKEKTGMDIKSIKEYGFAAFISGKRAEPEVLSGAGFPQMGRLAPIGGVLLTVLSPLKFLKDKIF